jgi:hypothetical protein
VDCDAFGLTSDVLGIKVPGDPLTVSITLLLGCHVVRVMMMIIFYSLM